jgi:hypothetical protein
MTFLLLFCEVSKWFVEGDLREPDRLPPLIFDLVAGALISSPFPPNDAV